MNRTVRKAAGLKEHRRDASPEAGSLHVSLRSTRQKGLDFTGQLSTIPSNDSDTTSRRRPDCDDDPMDVDGAGAVGAHVEVASGVKDSTSVIVNGPTGSEKTKKKRNREDPLVEWLPFRDQFLDEVIRLDGPPADISSSTCAKCAREEDLYRCHECCLGMLVCRLCLVDEHRFMPLHVVEVWSSYHFKRVSLAGLGLIIYLGHGRSSCPSARSPESVTVVHFNGIHVVNVSYCYCSHLLPPLHLQLLRNAWWPATTSSPQTAITFATLDYFQKLSIQSKINGFDFYTTLHTVTDITGLTKLPMRYKEFMRCMREFRNIMMAKRSGRGHDGKGVAGATPGSAAVICPPCPHPGKNLPVGWQDAPENKKFLYAQHFASDANFRQKSKDRNLHDITLGEGWSYFVQQAPYKAHWMKHWKDAEPNLCKSNLHAIDHANAKGRGKLRATGIGGVVCTRHVMCRPNAFGDLQKGERFCNMDFLLLSTLRHSRDIMKYFFSYDIMCSYFKNLDIRIEDFDEDMQLDLDVVDATFLIPKFHLPAHGDDCQYNFSFNFTPGVGRTCGEGIEQIWAAFNALLMSLREMGPGSRMDTFDDHMGGWNIRKVFDLGNRLYALLEEAFEAIEKHEQLHTEFTSSLPQELINQWEDLITEWEAVHNDEKNPYIDVKNQYTMATVRTQLSKEEEDDARAGKLSKHEVTETAFIHAGLELEEQQRILRFRTREDSSRTATQQAEFQQKRTCLQHRISSWQIVQPVYMPGIELLRDSLIKPAPSSSETAPPQTTVKEATEDEHGLMPEPSDKKRRKASGELQPEWIPLLLPSDLPREVRLNMCSELLIEKETKLRMAQADDSLQQVRQNLRVKNGVWTYKRVHVEGSGQKPNTRAQSMLNRFQERIFRSSTTYRVSRRALFCLDPDGDWQLTFLPLLAADVRFPGLDDNDYIDERIIKSQKLNNSHLVPGEGHRVISWIWRASTYNPQDAASEREMHEAMRVEWLRSRARVQRWKEERLLLVEEMRRTITYLLWSASHWRSQASLRTVDDVQLQMGLKAYAFKQVDLWTSLAKRFAKKWEPLLERHHVDIPWTDVLLSPAAKGQEPSTSTPTSATTAGANTQQAHPIADENADIDGMPKLVDSSDEEDSGEEDS